VAFAIVQLLAENKQMNPSQISRGVGRSVSRVSHVLAAWRLAEVVRYETDGTRARYRLKHARQTRQILKALSEFIDSASLHGDSCVFAQLRKYDKFNPLI